MYGIGLGLYRVISILISGIEPSCSATIVSYTPSPRQGIVGSVISLVEQWLECV